MNRGIVSSEESVGKRISKGERVEEKKKLGTEA